MFYHLLLLGALSWAARGVHRVCGESRGCHHRNVQLPPTHQVQRICCQRKYLWKLTDELQGQIRLENVFHAAHSNWRMKCNISWGCVKVLMFCEWAELGPLCQCCGDQAIQSWSALAAVPRDSSSPLLLHLPACGAFSLHLPLSWLQSFQRGCITVALSLCVSFHYIKRETSFVTKWWSLSKKSPHLQSRRCSLHWVFILLFLVWLLKVWLI